MLKSVKKSGVYSKLMLLIGVILMTPLLVLPFYPEELEYAWSFIIPSLSAIFLGLLCCACSAKKRKKLEDEADDDLPHWQSPMQKGSVPVLFAWCFGCLLGAVPFVIAGKLSFVHALFESVSGWTTTGLTLVDVTKTPHIFLFHRSFMQYCGGLGFILMLLMLVAGKQAMNLYSAEGHPDRLMPSLKKTVRTIFIIYNCFLALGVAAYCIFGMNLFDAVCHTMSALSTAGFTTKAGSIGEYGSFPIEVITIVLMLIGATNFAALLLLSRFKLKEMLKISELRFMLALIVSFMVLSAFSLMKSTDMGFFESVHQALFGVVTVFTTTGYSTMNYSAWPQFAVGLIMLLMIIGGSVGSTAGGIKLSRTYLILRIVRQSIKKRLSPSRSVTVENYYTAQGKMPINDVLISDTVGFVFCYIAVFIIGSLLITVSENCTLFDAMFEFASAFGTVGISNGLTSTAANNFTLIVEMVGMLLGRLEVFIVFVAISTAISKAKSRLFKKA